MYYQRTKASGATYFFTLNLQNRKSDLLTENINELRHAFKKVKQNHPFDIDAIVILPEHCHLLMTLPINDKEYSKRLSLIKGYFSRQINHDEPISTSRLKSANAAFGNVDFGSI